MLNCSFIRDRRIVAVTKNICRRADSSFIDARGNLCGLLAATAIKERSREPYFFHSESREEDENEF